MITTVEFQRQLERALEEIAATTLANVQCFENGQLSGNEIASA